jgi:uncharacterized membrane protein YccC
MSASTAVPAREPFFILPGFYPDAVGFAVRTTISLLLGYLIAFWVQLDSVATVGVCVAIVAQPSPGMALSKALYRVAGTLLGGVVAVTFTSLFPQDRTMLLVAFTVWLGLCTFVAALLRDFRSYGAVLCGYTVGLIAIAGIDAPGGVFIAALDRVAAILIGVFAVAIVNGLFARNVAYNLLTSSLREQFDAMNAIALDALAGRWSLTDMACAQHGAAILALASQASYAAAELSGSRTRGNGARSAIAALLGMLAASRTLGIGQRLIPPDPETRAILDEVAAAIRNPAGTALPTPAWSTPEQACLRERAYDLQTQQALVLDGLRTLAEGVPGGRHVRLGVHYDVTGAFLSALRTVIAVGLGSVFCVLSGWGASTLQLEIQAAFTALFGMTQNPSMATVNYMKVLPVAAAVVGVVGFVLLPLVSGFTLFALTVAPVVVVIGLTVRHPRMLAYGPALLWYFTLLLEPANVQSFDLSVFLNTIALLIVSLLFIVLSFRLILPISPRRRLTRLSRAIVKDLRRTLAQGRMVEQATAQSLHYDRLGQAELWLGPLTPVRQALFQRLFIFAELEVTLDQTWSGLDDALRAAPGLAQPVAAARASLTRPMVPSMVAAARALLDHPDAPRARPPVLRAVSGLCRVQYIIQQQARALRRYGVLGEE